jgi:hypothetical protein
VYPSCLEPKVSRCLKSMACRSASPTGAELFTARYERRLIDKPPRNWQRPVRNRLNPGSGHLPQQQVTAFTGRTLGRTRLISQPAIPSGVPTGFIVGFAAGITFGSRNCSWKFPQDSTSKLCKLLTLLMRKCGEPLLWAQGVGRSNRPAPTIRKLLIYLQWPFRNGLAHLWSPADFRCSCRFFCGCEFIHSRSFAT